MKKHLYILFSLLLSGYLQAAIINIPADQPTIQAGIEVANNGDTVLVQPATYFENINFIGMNISVASLFLITQDTNYISQTIIDGSGGGSVVVFNNGEDTTAFLCGFTITNGSASCGGGVNCNSSNPTLEYLVISNNTGWDGGGICLDNSSPVLNNLIISNNEAIGLVPWIYDVDGGGIACFNGSNPTMQNVILSNNTARRGGGISCENSNPVLQNVTLSSNLATSNPSFFAGIGGGIYLANSNPEFQNVTIDNNSASHGGGIYFSNSSPALTNVIISNNLAIDYSYGGNGVNGGGIYCNSSTPGLENLIISRSTATTGGGIYCSSNSCLSLELVTITDNFASNAGGGICCSNSNLLFDSISRCNIYFNTALIGNDLYSDTLLEIIVDTFTVLYPTDYHAFPSENFYFDILNGKVEQVDADMYVSPQGDNANSGLSANEPVKNIWFALSKILADSLHPHTIHLLEGTYSTTENEEIFPVNMIDYVGLKGVSENSVILDAEGQSGVLHI
ncbi:MAG: hypothetical protein K8R86_06065, partial [Bacteroidales bacterium]|nr:hypothetical protein [Bacteroidales bacterium]